MRVRAYIYQLHRGVIEILRLCRMSMSLMMNEESELRFSKKRALFVL